MRASGSNPLVRREIFFSKAKTWIGAAKTTLGSHAKLT
jgi:hypothetical protein